MRYVYAITVFAVILSFVSDRKKTRQAFVVAAKRFLDVLPALLTMIVLVSIVLSLVPDKVIFTYLGNKNKFLAVLFASFFGSLTLMPGFVAFPLCGILLKKGIPYMVLSAFTATLMMVGVLTYPLEKKYFGKKVTIIRNVIGFFIAIFVALITGFFFGEVF